MIARQQGDPLSARGYDDVAQNTLVIAGGKSPQYTRNAQAAIAAAASHATLQTLPGQTHMVKAKAVRAVAVMGPLGVSLAHSGPHHPADEPDDPGGKHGMALLLPDPRPGEAPVAQ